MSTSGLEVEKMSRAFSETWHFWFFKFEDQLSGISCNSAKMKENGSSRNILDGLKICLNDNNKDETERCGGEKQ